MTTEPERVNEPLRVLWVNQYATPPDRAGGTRQWSLARHLRPCDVEVTVVAARQDFFRRRNVATRHGVVSREDVQGVPFIWIGVPEYDGNLSRLANMLSFAWRVARLATRELRRLDAVIGSTPQPFAALAGARLARRLGVPFILEVRDIWPQSLIDLGRYSRWHPMILLFAWIERRLLGAARGVLTPLPGTESYFRTRGIASDDIVSIPNGVDLDLVPAGVCAPMSEKFTVTYAGAHGLANSLGTLVQAAKVLQERGELGIRIRMIGDGPEKAALVSEARTLGLSNLEFAEPVPKARIYEALAASDALVICLKRAEVFDNGISPSKLFDYFAVARPVIFCVDASNNPVAEARAGITVPPEDPDALAEAIVRLRDLSARERSDFGRNGRAYVQERHDFSRLAQRLDGHLRTWLRS